MDIHQAAPVADKKKTNRKHPLTYNPATEIVRAEHLPLVIGMSLTTIWRWRRAGKFITPIRLGENSIGFRRVDIERWLAERAEGSV